MPVRVDRSLRLPESEYFAEPQAKSGIALHHTVCDDARTTLRIWRHDKTKTGRRRRVATAYVIDRDGTIYEAFDPACWAWQFGLSWRDDARVAFEKRFIGIEITSEGGLTEDGGRLYAYGRAQPEYEKSKHEAFDCVLPYRGYRWFDRYEPEQLDAVADLVDHLCDRFAIPRRFPSSPFAYHGSALGEFEGVIGHAMVRTDKSDPAPDPALWLGLERKARLEPTPIASSPIAAALAGPLNGGDLAALFTENAGRVDRMHVRAGSMVKALLMELERRRVFVELDTPAPDGHAVGYDVIQGDRGEVRRVARALGFENVTDRELEVRHA